MFTNGEILNFQKFDREFNFGDKVQVLGNRALIKAYQIGNGGWVDNMESVCNISM